MKLSFRAGLFASTLCLLGADAEANPPAQKSPPGSLGGLYAAFSRANPLAAHPAASPPAAATRQARPPHVARRRPNQLSLALLREAHARALSAPQSNAFLDAALIYDYEPGRLYRIDTSPRFLTTIALRPGEHLVSKAAGDTVRWVLGETLQGAGDTSQNLVVIKPVRGDLRTNLVLTTDQRSYFIDAVSHEEPIYTSIVSWNYPRDLALELRPPAGNPQTPVVHLSTPAEALFSPDQLNFDYQIEHPHQKRAPPWQPDRVFDDGKRTFIEFSSQFSTTDAPPLFLIGPTNKAELVNYHVSNRYYIVDRLIERAELRLGENPQLIVQITRSGAPG